MFNRILYALRLKKRPQLDKRYVLDSIPVRNAAVKWEMDDKGEVSIVIPQKDKLWVKIVSKIFMIPGKRVVVLDEVGSFLSQDFVVDNVNDLESITTLGFRGEALPSIAAVAQVDIVTRIAGETAGTYLSFTDGTVADRGSQSRSPGTTVTVRNLFRKVPARLKFLKSPATENSHIASVVSQYAPSAWCKLR